MPTAPLTVLVTRRVDPAHHASFLHWLNTGTALAACHPGFLGCGTFAPPAGSHDWQIVFRYHDQASLEHWQSSPDRLAWLAEGAALVHAGEARCATGLDSWFAASPPPRWKQAVVIWMAFFPVSLAVNAWLGDALARLPLLTRVLLMTMALTPLMVFVLVPLLTRLLRPWLATAPDVRLRV